MATISFPKLGRALSLALAGSSPLFGQLPSDSAVQFEDMATSGVMKLAIADPGNGFWMVQESTDLRSWSDYTSIKVNNGRYSIALRPIQDAPRGFYRATYDPAQQGGSLGADDALRLPSGFENYANPDLPPHFLTGPILDQDNTPILNPTTDAGATLGRVLFYDKRLSANHRISCSSCHQQEHGFSDPRQFSIGFEGGATTRNSMGLTNARYYRSGHFFWDERAATLEEQVLEPIQNEVEMGLSLDELVARVSAERYYGELFAGAFGDEVVTSGRIARALAQFVRAIISTESKYDRGRAVNFTNFTAQERLGRELFNGRARCATCHGTDNFVPGDVFNNGLENPYTDRGVGAVTGRVADNGKFKAPSLRNIAETAPYMHDGRFATLAEVVAFYDSQIVDHPNLAAQLRAGGPPRPGQPPQRGGPVRLNLSQAERDALVAFLRTLSDPNLAADPKYSDPFDYGD